MRRIERSAWPWLVAALGAAAPTIVATARAVSDGWYPYGDRGVIALRSFDVLTAHSPLLGQFSALSGVAGRSLFSPGPMLYWLLAIPSRLGGVWLPLTMGATNALLIAATVALARRRGGNALMLAAALGTAIMCRSLPSESLHDIWNPYASLMPFGLLLMLAWSVAVGEARWLPAVVVVASFIVESHLTFTLPAAVALGVAAAGCWPARHDPGVRRWARIALLAGLVCWAAPLLEVVVHPPGNLVHIAGALRRRHGSLGAAAGWHAVARAIGIPPWWLRAPIIGSGRLFEVAGSMPVAGMLTAGAELLALLAMVIGGLRRRRADLAAPAALALGGCVALGLAVASTPTQVLLGLTIAYTVWWASPLGLFVWLVLGWGLAVLLAPRLRRRIEGSAPGGLGSIGAAAALGVGVVLALGAPRDEGRGEYRAFDRAAADLAAGVPHQGSVLVSADPTIQAYELQTTAVYALLLQGHRVFTPPNAATALGHSFLLAGRHPAVEVAIGFGHTPPGGRVLARVTSRPPAPVVGTWTLVLRPGR